MSGGMSERLEIASRLMAALIVGEPACEVALMAEQLADEALQLADALIARAMAAPLPEEETA